MSEALTQIVNAYVRLNNTAALEDLKAHRQKLIAGIGRDGPFNRSLLLDQLNDEVVLIDAGLQKLREESNRE
jgi:hypothetical protein